MICSESKLENAVAKFVSGGTPSTKVEEYWNGDIPWITGADFDDGEVKLGRRFINELAIKSSATNIVPRGSILMVTRTGVGKIAIAPVDIAISQDITGIILKPTVNPKFIVGYIRSKMPTLLAAQRGATIKGITRNDLKSLPLQLPPPSEQGHIVDILNQADALRKQRDEADAKAALVLPALFYKMFGDPSTANNTLPISKLVASIERRNPSKQPEAKFNYIDIASIDGNEGIIIDTKVLLGQDAPSRARQIVSANDILISTVRPYLRATALIPQHLEGQICSTGFCVLRAIEGVGYGFLYTLSRLEWFTQQLNSRAKGASYPAVTDNDILDLQVPDVRNTNQFKKMDVIVSDLLSQKNERIKLQRKFESLFQVGIHRAFTGDLTANWREAHMTELLREMEIQSKLLGGKSA